MSLLLLALVLFGALLLIPLGLPGLWVMIVVAFLYNFVTGTEVIGTFTILGTTVLAAIAEYFEFVLAGRYARKYGGSRRAGWGAMLGGLVGAFVGIPVPIVGPMLGAFAGAFGGALLAELTVKADPGAATRVATGALLGRIAAVAIKSAIGCVILVWVVIGALG